VGRQKELESELESVKDRLDASQRAWSAMRRELEEQKSQRAVEIDRERFVSAVETQAKSFKECLSRLLSDGRVTVEPYEEMITQRLQEIILTLQQKSAVRTQLYLLSSASPSHDLHQCLTNCCDKVNKQVSVHKRQLGWFYLAALIT